MLVEFVVAWRTLKAAPELLKPFASDGVMQRRQTLRCGS